MDFDFIRIGFVDGINEQEGTVRVTFPDKDDSVANDVALMSSEQDYPGIGDSVLCLFLPNGSEQAFCLSKYYNDENPPPVKNKDMYVKKLDDGLVVKYDYKEKKLTIDALSEIQVNGNIRVSGTIRSGGD